MDSQVRRSRSNLYSMLQQHQAEISAQIETRLESVYDVNVWPTYLPTIGCADRLLIC